MKHGIIDGLEPLAVELDEIVPLKGNPRRGDVEAVMESYRRFGQRKPIVVRRSSNEVIAGNHQLEAARRLGWTHIAVVWTDDDDLTASAYALADNHVGELGEYDPDALATMLAEVAGDAELLAATAYTDADLDELLHRLDGPAEAQRGDAEVRQLDPVWGVIVSCENEAQQVDLLRRLTEEGHTVRALIS